MSVNEKKTEALVEKRLRQLGYYRAHNEITVEKGSSDTPRVQKLLAHASKRGTGIGKPDYLIRCSSHPDFIIVIECKGSPKNHVSPTRDQYADYAVDGVLLYASFLAKEFQVLAIAVSGQTESTLTISHFWHLQQAVAPVDWCDQKEFLSLADFYNAFLHSDAKQRQDYDALLAFSSSLNHELQSKKITEANRGFLISGILVALNNPSFEKTYSLQQSAQQLAHSLVATIQAEFERAELPEDRRHDLEQAFSFISRAPTLTDDRDFFVSLIKRIDNNVNSFMKTYDYYDTIGQFYVEFLRYANNDKGLGIVLTPPHIAALFSELADVNRNSIVFDNCCGTGGLLIAAMKKMVQESGFDQAKQERIRTERLYGIEYQPNIYALAVSNMILHGDGKTNLFRADCFKRENGMFRERRPNVGLVNPPYKNKKATDDKEELEYVLNNLDSLEPGGTCVAIVPITCVTAPSEWKRVLLSRHTLEATMSMPIELFRNSNTSVVTCVVVFTAHRPHPGDKKTWFGYWRDDGFVKVRNLGRVDANGTWPEIQRRWVTSYHNREIVSGESVAQIVDAQDEWCAEAYMDFDYSTITHGDLKRFTRVWLVNRIMI